MSFLAELKRRNVFRVAIAYIIVAWLLLQVADTLVPALHLPEWFISGIALLLILGFPIAIIFAWAFEMTPDGVKREREVDRSQSITPQTGQKLNITIIVLLAVAVAYFATDKFLLQDRQPPVDEVVQTSVNPSIAVLPFVNMSDDASNEFFADGITEELLNLLAKIPELDVTSRSSAFAFKGKDIDIPDVADKLNVDHVLEGSVRKSGVKIRITAQLIDAHTDKHMWSETYDRELTDIFAIQDEIAKEVVDVLQVTLLGAAPTVKETDTRAYALYLEGLHYLDLDRSETWAKAMELFEEALAIDPLYAPAWFGKARAMREMANFGDADIDEGTELARQWASHATELDPSLSEAWALLAHISLIYDWDWTTAQELIDRALQEGPNNPASLGEAAMLEQTLGRLDRSLEYKQRALSLDPLSQIRIREAGIGHWWNQDYEKANELFSKNAELYPDNAWPGDIVVTRIMQGRLGEAEELTDALADQPYLRNFIGAYVYQAVGREEEAAAATQWIIGFRGVPLSYQVAEMYAWQGNPDKAFEWLDTGFETRDGGMSYLLVDPWLESLHDDPRWRVLLTKMNLLEYWDEMRQRQSGD
ncbi:MAG: hypothetical protein GWP67_06265 [Gammaproteobacteria bacterium]|jgi:TolB-like protein|nr:hypothetical protein [Gammaproteobacteria bacterium]